MTGTSDMEYNYLGKTGVKVSCLCLGTMTFGKQQGGPFNFFDTPTHSDEEMSHQLLNRFLELGGNFVDTANIYGGGAVETILGNWMKTLRSRDDVVIATKVRNATKDKEPNNVGLSRRHIIRALEGSLERLRTEYIDLYQGHGWDNATPVEETLRTFEDLVRSGKIRYYGYSNLCGWQMQKVVETEKRLGLQPCVTLQQQYSLVQRHSEWEAFMVCENEGIGILPWSPLHGGLLSGKFSRGVAPNPATSRLGFMYSQRAVGQLAAWQNFSSDDNFWELVDVLKDIAKEHGKTPAQIALKWLLQKRNVSSVIFGATSIKQLEENAKAGGNWRLSEQQIQVLDGISKCNEPYPYDMVWNARNAQRYNSFHHGSVLVEEHRVLGARLT